MKRFWAKLDMKLDMIFCLNNFPQNLTDADADADADDDDDEQVVTIPLLFYKTDELKITNCIEVTDHHRFSNTFII